MNAKIEEMVNKGKLAATAGFEKGNEMMDKVPALKSKRNKLLVWGGIAVVLLLGAFCLFSGGTATPFEVVKESMIAISQGDLETFIGNVYFSSEQKEEFSKLSDAEVADLEKEFVKEFASSFENMSEDELAALQSAFAAMKEVKTSVDGDVATVTWSVSRAGESIEQSEKLKKDDGTWKIKVD